MMSDGEEDYCNEEEIMDQDQQSDGDEDDDFDQDDDQNEHQESDFESEEVCANLLLFGGYNHMYLTAYLLHDF
jgi:TATA-binding protein-associated factor Taf7